MAQWHLDELRRTVEKKGWRIAELPGDDYHYAATWELRRARDERVFHLDFNAFTEVGCLPFEKSWGYTLRGTEVAALFTRPRARDLWEHDLAKLMNVLDGR